MTVLKVINVKCGGCEANIVDSLEKLGLTNVKVNSKDQTVSFTGDEEIAKKKLAKMGYPEVSSPEAKKILGKAKSYLSCLIGKTKK